MNDPLTADERLAALADGRLGERERAEMLAHLTADDDAYDVLSGLAAILRDAEAAEAGETVPAADEKDVTLPGTHPVGAPPAVTFSADAGGARQADADNGVIPLHPRKPAGALRVLALAAGIVGLALAVRALWPSTSSAGEPVRLAARLEHVERGLPEGWSPDWSSSRGDGVSGNLSREEKAVLAARAGTQLVDLSVAVRGRDAARTQLLARQIAERYDRQHSRTGVWNEIAEGAGEPPRRLEPLVERGTNAIATRLGREALELAAWTEAARLAVNRQDSRFFRDRGTILERLASRATAHPPARVTVDRVRDLAKADPLQWDALAAALRVLSNEIAND